MKLPFKTPQLFRTLLLAASFLVFLASAQAATYQDKPLDPQRAKLLGFIVTQHLTQQHYNHAPLDDDLSRAAFDLYIKQLDNQKRFLLREDVQMLGAYKTYIDNEIRRGNIHLPLYSARIMEKRIPALAIMVQELLQNPFDYERDETLETDRDKLDFCNNQAELRERWRKTLKYQTASVYLDLKDEQVQLAKKPEGTVPTSAISPDTPDSELWTQARTKVAERYQHLFARMEKVSENDFFDRYLNAIANAYDPHSAYMPPEAKEDFDIHMRGSLEGIGAVLREDGGYIKVVNLIPGGAAQQQGGLASEDIILSVSEGQDGEPVDITDTRIRDAVSLIRGPKGTTVKLHIKKPDGTQHIIALKRDVVQIKDAFVKSAVIDGPGKARYGYLKIPSFYRDFHQKNGKGRNVTDDTRIELEKMGQKGISGLIIDLRNNGGGSLGDAVDTTGLFIEKGPVVQVQDSNQDIKVMVDPGPKTAYTGPIVVLVNKFSASASEILAGALQDYRRAVIVGSEHTHGKGTVQAMINIDTSLPMRNMNKYMPLGAIKVTVQKFYRVSGASTQYRGIEPDIVLPDRFAAIESGERHLDYSLPWDTIPSTLYHPVVDSLPLEELRQRSGVRIQASSEFQKIITMEAKTRERIANTKQSLLLSAIHAEREEMRDKDDASGHSVMDDDSTTEDDAQWFKRLTEDPYVNESGHILDDITELMH
ncbi:MAG: carboxy terminal-processing peptidase [Desulfuromonadaceae bacterium]|nr:carboxy terminal-processing peptidase [Desulfuromonadaceae bacterium]